MKNKFIPILFSVLLGMAFLAGFGRWRGADFGRSASSVESAMAPPVPASPVSPTSGAQTPKPVIPVPPAGVAVGAGEPAVPAASVFPQDPFREWMRRYERAAASERDLLLPEGRDLAEARRVEWIRAIPQDPEGILDRSLGFAEWNALPEAVRRLVERPFSETVDYRVFPVCAKGVSHTVSRRPEARIHWKDGHHARAFLTGSRRELGSKNGLPVQGVAIAGLAAVRPRVLEPLPAADLPFARSHFEPSPGGPNRSFVTGAPIQGPGVHAVAGGRMFLFATREELQTVENTLAELDRLPAPTAGSGLLCSYPAARTAGGEWQPASVQAAASALSLDYTTGRKKIFLIRVRFSESDLQPPSRQEIVDMLNGDVASDIESFSLGKASIAADASHAVYVLPQGKNFYSGAALEGYESADFTSSNDALLEAAKDAFSQGKAGADFSTKLEDFQVVGVSFPEAGCKNKGLKYAGLASIGAGDLWMQGNNERSVYVHELGHVFGLEHANFWKVSSTSAPGFQSVVGAGEEKEYGDIFDVMGDGKAPRGHFHPQAKRRLFWFESAQIGEVTQSGVFQVYRHDAEQPPPSGNSGQRLRGLRIPKGTGQYYWVGYRSAYSENPGLAGGAYLLWQRSGTERCCLLDTTPGSAEGKTDSGLEIGRTYADSEAGVYITPVERGVDDALTSYAADPWLKVRVHVGNVSGNQPPEAVAGIQGPAVWRARTAATFSVDAGDPDQDTDLAFYWEGGDGTQHSQNGVNQSTFSWKWETAGTYTVRVTVSDMKGGSLTLQKEVRVEDPAADWMKSSITDATNYSAVAASPWLAVAVNEGGGIQTSVDGLSWTDRSLPEKSANLKFHAIAWSERLSRFVAVGRDWDSAARSWFGVAYASDNGIDWARVYEAPVAPGFEGSTLQHIVSGSAGWVAAGYSGTVVFSPDGITWHTPSSRPPLGTDSLVTGLASGNGVTLLIAHTIQNSVISPEARVFSSANGEVWNETTPAAVSGGWRYLKEVFFVKDRFIASGMDGKLWVSLDGGSTFSTVLESIQGVTAAAWASGLYFATGFTGSSEATSGQSGLFSMDGLRWVTRPASEFSKRAGLAVFQDQLLAVGAKGQIWKSAPLGRESNRSPLIQSMEGLSARARAPATFSVSAVDPDGDALRYWWDAGSGTTQNTSAAYTGVWVAGGSQTLRVTVNDGQGGVATRSETIRVEDALQNFSAVVGGGTQNLNGVAASEGMLVAVGNRGEIRTSSDGVTWTSRSIPGELNLHLRAVAWGNQRFVAVGENWSSSEQGWYGAVYASDDGVAWERVYSAGVLKTSLGSGLKAVAYGDGKWIATGAGGTVLGSSDGKNWAAENIAVSGTRSDYVFSDVAYGGGLFLTVAYKGAFGSAEVWAYSSAGGWRQRSAAVSGLDSWQDFRTVRYVKDRFVAGGFYSKLWTSTDGGATFTTTRTEQEPPRFAVWSDGAYFAFAADGYVEDSGGFSSPNALPVGVVSVDGVHWTRLSLPPELQKVSAGVAFKGRVYAVGAGGGIWRTAAPLRILVHPKSKMATSSEDVSLNVFAVGLGTLRYQWYREGSELAGETRPILNLAASAPNRAGSYSVTVSDDAGGSVQSVSAEISLPELTGLSVVQNPESINVLEGSPGRLHVVVASTAVPITYVWRRNGIRLPGASGEVLEWDALRLEDEGWYRVEAFSSAGAAVSREVFVRVCSEDSGRRDRETPLIIRHPAGHVVLAGSPVELSVEALPAVGQTVPLTYQWRKDGQALPGQSQRLLKIDSPRTADTGFYSVQVIAPNGTALSRSVPITVTAATASPSLVLQKQPSGVDRLLRQASVLNPELNAGAAAYQWFRNGMRLPGATGRELTVPSSRLGGEDIYQLLATDETGAAILSRQISVRTRDFSAWAGSFQSLLFDARSERVRGRATVSITSQGGVSGVFHWESAVFRMAGQLGSDLKLESGTRGADAENVKCVLHCDTEEGLVVFSIQKGALTVASGSHSIRPGIRSFPLGFSAPVERSLLLESLGTQASGVLSGISGPLGVARWRRESPRTVLSFAKMADGSAWTCSSIPLKDASFVCFSSFVSPYPRSKAWIGGVVSEQETASGQFLDWFRTAPPDGPASAACDARLFLSASGFSSGAFLNERRFAATAGALDLQTKQPDGVLRNIPFQWSPGSLVLRSLFASSVFSDVSLNIHPRTGFVWGVSGGGSVTAPNSGRFEWTGLIFPMDANGPYRVRGFVRKTPWPEWITPFELLPQDAP